MDASIARGLERRLQEHIDRDVFRQWSSTSSLEALRNALFDSNSSTRERRAEFAYGLCAKYQGMAQLLLEVAATLDPKRYVPILVEKALEGGALNINRIAA